jgi:hypothetical protein
LQGFLLFVFFVQPLDVDVGLFDLIDQPADFLEDVQGFARRRRPDRGQMALFPHSGGVLFDRLDFKARRKDGVAAAAAGGAPSAQRTADGGGIRPFVFVRRIRPS